MDVHQPIQQQDLIRLIDERIAQKIVKDESDQHLTLLVMSNSFDRLLAAFILAVSAASTGKQVQMFFTFWGVTAIRRKKLFAKKSIGEKLVTLMLPASPRHVHPSQFSFLGVGRKFFDFLMKRQNVTELETLIDTAQELGVKFIACDMSMRVMGIREDELREGCIMGGAAVYLEGAFRSRANLFI